jgi:beta-glucosidase
MVRASTAHGSSIYWNKRPFQECDSIMTMRPAYLKFTATALLLAGLLISYTPAFAADEVCSSCSPQVTVTGTFAHRRENQNVAIDGAGNRAAAFREDVNGQDFTVAIATLPAGKYTITIGAAETSAAAAGQRVFDVTSEGTSLAKDFDIFAAAGGARKVATITGTVEHTDDALRGPLKISFVASKGAAKFNTIEIKSADGKSVVSFSASELADAFSAAAERAPDVKDAPFWRDSTKPLAARIDDLIRRMSLAEKVAQLKNAAPAISRLGLPAYDYWNEALHGVANNGVATVFPEPTGGASSWNPSLFRQEGNVIGIEGRAKHNDYATKNNGDSKWWTGLTFWTPNVNIFRDPRWGRGQETYGEDPFLSAEIGIQFVKGIQGDDPNYMLAMACAKHYAVHSGPESSRHTFDARVSDRDLYETYLPQFERVVREGKVAGVMSAYNSVAGVPASASTFLLDDLLRKQWGFEGYIVCDCDAIRDIFSPAGRGHNYAPTQEAAAAAAIKAGVDLCCGSDYNALVRAAQSGLVTEKDIDRALHYTLWTRFRMGLFDPADKVPYAKLTISDNDTPEHRQVSLELARQSMVLLKNDGILPLDRSKYKRIAVIGPNGNSKSMLEGNYHGSASNPITILAGIKQSAGAGIEVNYAMGSAVTSAGRGAAWSNQDNSTTRTQDDLATEAIKLARDSDLVIYVGGITALQEGEGFDRTAIEVPPIQEKFVQDLHAVGKPMVMVNCSGSAMALTWENENIPAIVQAWYPGGDGGKAVAEVLFGDVNPSGHLAVTFYRATSDLPAFTDYSMANRTYKYFNGKPLYAFGHGLSYTTFDYSAGKLDSNRIAPNGKVNVSFTLKNTGKRDGDEVVQVYYRHVNSKVPQPKLALCGFTRASLKSGNATDVTVEVPTERLRYWDTDKKQYVVEPGDYEILVGAASDDIKLKLPLAIAAP